MREKKGMLPMILGGVLVTAALAVVLAMWGQGVYARHRAGHLAQSLAAQLPPVAPGVYRDDPVMARMQVEGVSLVGILATESGAFGICGGDTAPRGLPYRYGGSAAGGDLAIIMGSGQLRQTKPGDAVTFTDVTGGRYAFRVTEVAQSGSAAFLKREAPALYLLEPDALTGSWRVFTCSPME